MEIVDSDYMKEKKGNLLYNSLYLISIIRIRICYQINNAEILNKKIFIITTTKVNSNY